jgi:hypothetical protein
VSAAPPQNHRKFQLLVMQVLDHVFHLERRLHQQAAQTDGVSPMFQRGVDNRVRRLLDAEVHHLETVIGRFCVAAYDSVAKVMYRAERRPLN